MCLKTENAFLSLIDNGSEITSEDLQKVDDVLKCSFSGMESQIGKYIFKFKCVLWEFFNSYQIFLQSKLLLFKCSLILFIYVNSYTI